MINTARFSIFSIAFITLVTFTAGCAPGSGGKNAAAKASSDTTTAPVSGDRFNSEDGKFKVHFEGKPNITSEKVPTAVGDIEVHMFLYEKSATEIYLVGYSDYPSELIKKSNAAEVIKGAQGGVVEKLKAKITEEKKISVGGNDGIWFRANSDQYYITYKLFLSGNRLYQIGMIRDGSHVSDEAVKSFMDTFELLK